MLGESFYFYKKDLLLSKEPFLITKAGIIPDIPPPPQLRPVPSSYNPMWLTGLKASTNQPTFSRLATTVQIITKVTLLEVTAVTDGRAKSAQSTESQVEVLHSLPLYTGSGTKKRRKKVERAWKAELIYRTKLTVGDKRTKRYPDLLVDSSGF